MKRENLSVACGISFVMELSEIDAFFEAPEVKIAYERFKKEGYLKKLSAIVQYDPVSMVQAPIEMEDFMRLYIVQVAVGCFLFTQLTQGDVKKSLVLYLNSESWRKDIDEEYEKKNKNRPILH